MKLTKKQLVERVLTRFARLPGVISLWRRSLVGDLDRRVSAADLAARLELGAIWALELGVAGGRGLLSLQAIAREAAGRFGITIRVIGCDRGKRMLPALDCRDLPHGPRRALR